MLCAVAASCGYPELPSPSCAGLAASCGAGENRSCCEAAMVPGGQFYRGDDQAADALHKDMDHPAMVSAFVLDRYEVTVGRFRQFVAEGKGTQQGSPASGAGAHPASRDSGWDSAWDGKLAADTAALIAAVQCDAKYSTWTDSAGSGDNKPINCVTWYEAMAFCIWDGGYLPTEAEWSFAASGGSEQRAYPWSVPASSTTIDCSYANYQLTASPATYCTNGSIGGTRPAGREPLGDGKWGHSDLAGNVFEWMLDWYTAYPVPCMDCAALATPDPAQRVLRGGGFFNEDVSILRSNYRLSHGPSVRSTTYGVRCARTP
jgi:formylglycine-generating enzyme required for sulfatase activity